MMEKTYDSLPAWIDAVRRGDEEGARVLWERFFPDVLRLARKRLAGMPGYRSEPEDVALSVMKSILLALQKGRLPDLQKRDELWRLLCVTTRRKAVDAIRYHNIRPEVAGVPDSSASALPPDVIAASLEEVRRLLGLLNNHERKAVELRFAGFTVKEISQQCGRGVSTIELYLKSARDKWSTALRT